MVYIISGRRKSELEDWLGDVPRLVRPRALLGRVYGFATSGFAALRALLVLPMIGIVCH